MEAVALVVAVAPTHFEINELLSNWLNTFLHTYVSSYFMGRDSNSDFFFRLLKWLMFDGLKIKCTPFRLLPLFHICFSLNFQLSDTFASLRKFEYILHIRSLAISLCRSVLLAKVTNESPTKHILFTNLCDCILCARQSPLFFLPMLPFFIFLLLHHHRLCHMCVCVCYLWWRTAVDSVRFLAQFMTFDESTEKKIKSNLIFSARCFSRCTLLDCTFQFMYTLECIHTEKPPFALSLSASTSFAWA